MKSIRLPPVRIAIYWVIGRLAVLVRLPKLYGAIRLLTPFPAVLAYTDKVLSRL